MVLVKLPFVNRTILPNRLQTPTFKPITSPSSILLSASFPSFKPLPTPD